MRLSKSIPIALIAATLTGCGGGSGVDTSVTTPVEEVKPPEQIYTYEGHYTFRYLDGDTLDKGTKAKLIWYPDSKKLEYGFISPNNNQYNRYTCTDRGSNILTEQLNPDKTVAFSNHDNGDKCIITYDKEGMPEKMIAYQGATSTTCPAGAECDMVKVSNPWKNEAQGSTAATQDEMDKARQAQEEYRFRENMKEAAAEEIERQRKYNEYEAQKICKKNPYSPGC